GVLRDEDVLEDERTRDGAAHAERIPVAGHGYARSVRRNAEIERVATHRFFAFGSPRAEGAVIIGGAGQRGEDLPAVDDIAAFDGLRLGAESDRTGGGRTAFREGLRIDRAVSQDALVMDFTAL